MCGRYTLKTPIDVLAEHFGLREHPPSLTPSYNIAPTQHVAAVVEEDGGGRRLETFRWGLVPSWAKDPSIGNKMINARAETVAEKPSFRSAFKRRRCLIVADGFYEWQKTDGGKQPHYFRMEDSSPFAFAGLWETWSGYGEEIRSCAIVTTDANDLMREIHHRMPVILPAENHAAWLDPGFEDKEALLDLLRPYPSDRMEAYPVSRRVNRPANNEPGVVEPAA
ncbi:MAG: SOS response-associated peptidase [Actinomycetota bacterium]|nr:SOS response-associated peptidase [Actinomycetota bacterium]